MNHDLMWNEEQFKAISICAYYLWLKDKPDGKSDHFWFQALDILATTTNILNTNVFE
jgi:hypothetical protein